MKSKALWVGLLAVGVADWLLVNAVVGPAYLASGEKPAMASTPEYAAVAAALPGSPPVPGDPEVTTHPPTVTPPVPGGPEATVTPPVPGDPEATAHPPTVTPPVPGGPEATANPPTVTPPVPGGPEAVPPPPKTNDVAAATTSLPPTEPLLFTRQSAELGDDARRSLKNVSKYLLENPDATVVIEGHADRRGKDEFNEWLSLQRARAVRAYLHGLGVRTKRMRIEARGSNDPIDTSGSEAARAKNRRVELIVK